MLAIARTPVNDKTTGQLTAELAELGAGLMVEVLSQLEILKPAPQDDTLACYAPKIDKDETRIDWSRHAIEVERQVRAFAPAPGAWFELDGERVKLLGAELVDGSGAPGEVLDDHFTIACETGAVRPLRLQRAGKPAMDRPDFLRGRPVAAGALLA